MASAPNGAFRRSLRWLLCVPALTAAGCSPPAAPAGPDAGVVAAVSYGTAMADVGRRFELAGRAALARRFELARYEVRQIEAAFRSTLPRATPPQKAPVEVLEAQRIAFVRTGLPDLARAADARDAGAFADAFARAATRCNRCHEAAEVGFIAVPAAMGRAIPNLERAPAPATP